MRRNIEGKLESDCSKMDINVDRVSPLRIYYLTYTRLVKQVFVRGFSFDRDSPQIVHRMAELMEDSRSYIPQRVFEQFTEGTLEIFKTKYIIAHRSFPDGTVHHLCYYFLMTEIDMKLDKQSFDQMIDHILILVNPIIQTRDTFILVPIDLSTPFGTPKNEEMNKENQLYSSLHLEIRTLKGTMNFEIERVQVTRNRYFIDPTIISMCPEIEYLGRDSDAAPNIRSKWYTGIVAQDDLQDLIRTRERYTLEYLKSELEEGEDIPNSFIVRPTSDALIEFYGFPPDSYIRTTTVIAANNSFISSERHICKIDKLAISQPDQKKK